MRRWRSPVGFVVWFVWVSCWLEFRLVDVFRPTASAYVTCAKPLLAPRIIASCVVAASSATLRPDLRCKLTRRSRFNDELDTRNSVLEDETLGGEDRKARIASMLSSSELRDFVTLAIRLEECIHNSKQTALADILQRAMLSKVDLSIDGLDRWPMSSEERNIISILRTWSDVIRENALLHELEQEFVLLYCFNALVSLQAMEEEKHQVGVGIDSLVGFGSPTVRWRSLLRELGQSRLPQCLPYLIENENDWERILPQELAMLSNTCKLEFRDRLLALARRCDLSDVGSWTAADFRVAERLIAEDDQLQRVASQASKSVNNVFMVRPWRFSLLWTFMFAAMASLLCVGVSSWQRGSDS